MTSPDRDTQRIKVKVPPEEIVLIDMIFKASEGIATLTVDHKKKGVINLDVTEGTRADVMLILENLKKKIPLEILKE
ncbi:DUF4911 domain-containing protein [Halothermothrix orenii]|uniref:DUF4911 domain-containing protein n=1 Tax=Halothermothrix orenii (strain H 168 / OCM 544 / DSM 9562) TaxID=373903 RepID=B8D2B5_HALOH|nr:DUF4911 domain-containing protein [Halothermothrix orenii]ACL69342.1 hypothetical protein Hore_05850 [Halothermothrix orenii H 168]